jgi:hypothetical protein
MTSRTPKPKCQKSGCDFLRNQRRKSNSTSGRN